MKNDRAIFKERRTKVIPEYIVLALLRSIIDLKKLASPAERIPRSDALPLSHRDDGERGTRRSEVRFLMGTQKFFFFPRS